MMKPFCANQNDVIKNFAVVMSVVVKMVDCINTELQIRGGIEDNSKTIFLFLNKNIHCDPSLEPSRQDGSNDGSQNKF